MEQFYGASLTPQLEEIPDLMDPRNYADDREVVERVRAEILSELPRMHQVRQTLQDRWDRFYKVWDGVHDKQLYQGRADLYWRLGRKIVNTFVSHIKTRVFPSVDSFYIETDPMDVESSMLVPQVRRLLRHDIEQAQVEQKLPLFLREGLIAGTAVSKHVWDVKTSRLYGRVANQDMPGKVGFATRTVSLYEGPTFIPLNLLDFYVHPITVENLDDARIVLENVYVDRAHLLGMERQGRYLNVRPVLEDDGMGRRSYSDIHASSSKDVRNRRSGISESDGRDKNKFVLQEIWCKFDLYDNGEDVACKIVAIGDQVLEIRQNPYMDQRPPYRVWRPVQVRNSFYGQGIIESIEHLNIAANAIGNQMLDAVQFQTNHILGVNQAMLAQDVSTLRIAPRAIWTALGNPNEVFSIIRPPDNSQAAMMVLQLLSGAMQDIAGAPPFLQGKGTSKDTTATEVAAIASGADAALGDMVRDVEVHVLSPLLKDWWIREQQFRAIESAAKIGPYLRLSPEDLLGDFAFRWMVTSQVPPEIEQVLAQGDALAAAGSAVPTGPGDSAQGLLGAGATQPQGLGTDPQLGL